MKFTSVGLGGAALIGALMFAGAASAAPIMATGISAGEVTSSSNIVQVQVPRRAIRAAPGPVRGGRGVAVRRGGRGIGPGGAAAIGLGVLGAAVAIGAAQSYPRRECWVEQQPVNDRWGNFIGYRNVRVCN